MIRGLDWRMFAFGVILSMAATWSKSAGAQTQGEMIAVPESSREVFIAAEKAREAGEVERERELLEETIQRIGPTNPQAFPVYERLRHNYADRGLYQRALEVGDRQLRVAAGPGQEFNVLSSMVGLHVSLHQLKKAQAMLERMEQVLNRLRGSRRWQVRGDWWQAGLASAKASVQASSGHLAEAEDSLKACLMSANAALRENPDFEGSVQTLECYRKLMDIQIATGQLAAAGVTADQLRVTAE